MIPVGRSVSKLSSLPTICLVVAMLAAGAFIAPEPAMVEGLVPQSTAPLVASAESPARGAVRQPPRFSGVATYHDPLERFSIRYPSDWYLESHERAGRAGRPGVTFRPRLEDAETYLSVEVRELEGSIVAEDLGGLRASLEAALGRLPGVRVEGVDETVLDDLIRLEVVYSFRSSEEGSEGRQAGEIVLKRKTWILYADRWEYTVTWQGSSVEEYEHWLAMANYSFAFFQLPPALWFATDRGTIEGLPAVNGADRTRHPG